MTAIAFDRVTKRFGTTEALRDVSFVVQRGEMFGLIGPDGAGKTTAIRLMGGLLHPDGGSLGVLGLDPARDHRTISQQVGYLSQRFTLYGDLSIDENIAFFAEMHVVGDYRARRERLLAMTQLTPFRRRLAERLSGGMQKKLALACTLVHEPSVLLLDEPTTGVDPVSRRELWKLLWEFRSQGMTIVMATPYLDEAERCSRVALLHEGELLALDDPSEMRAAFAGDVLEVVAEPYAAAWDELRRLPGVAAVQTFGERAHVYVPSGEGQAAELAIAQALERAGLSVTGLRRVVPSLEDVFIEKVTRSRP